MADQLQFPYPNSASRLQQYDYFERLFMGEHFQAFNIKIDSEAYTKEYGKLRYIAVNFAGLVSKVVADFLFSEPIKVSFDDGDQEFGDALIHENNLHTQNYESALSNSYKGDALYKLRIDKRNPTDKNPTIIIEDVTPNIYFPHINPSNVRAKPEVEELAWQFEYGGKQYVRQELHSPGQIAYHVWLLNGNQIAAEVDPAEAGITSFKYNQVDKTGIDRNLIVHVPNWKPSGRYFGLSDYFDMQSIFYAINNRITKTDNILDKHSDPILAVPEGVLDASGNVERAKLNMIEIPKTGTGVAGEKPEYIVWNASLDNAFKEIEKLVEFMYMMTETSPDILGMGQGMSDSGRALKLKLLRTIAKASRKKLYYDHALKEVLYIAQLLAKTHPDVLVGGLKLKAEPVIPDITWSDGLPIDNSEQVDTEVKRIDAGLTTKKDAIIRIDGVDEETAEGMVEEIDQEGKITLPESHATASTTDMADNKMKMDMMGKDPGATETK